VIEQFLMPLVAGVVLIGVAALIRFGTRISVLETQFTNISEWLERVEKKVDELLIVNRQE